MLEPSQSGSPSCRLRGTSDGFEPSLVWLYYIVREGGGGTGSTLKQKMVAGSLDYEVKEEERFNKADAGANLPLCFPQSLTCTCPCLFTLMCVFLCFNVISHVQKGIVLECIWVYCLLNADCGIFLQMKLFLHSVFVIQTHCVYPQGPKKCVEWIFIPFLPRVKKIDVAIT